MKNSNKQHILVRYLIVIGMILLLILMFLIIGNDIIKLF